MSDQTASIPITIRGRYLWRGDERFIVRGVVYQISKIQDPISDDRLPQLEHDVSMFKDLGLNTIYVYSIDTTKPHTLAMELLENAGIYVLTSVSTPSRAINRLSPHASYTPPTISTFFRAVDTMAPFPNTLGVLAGVDVVNNAATLRATPVLRAVVRDLKTHMARRRAAAGQRVVPVGYAAAGTEWDAGMAAWLCKGERDSAVDFWTFRYFAPAPDLGTAQANVAELVTTYASLPIPAFVSEYGALPRGREFHDTTALYAPATTRVLSGGCVYEFWNAANGYGLVGRGDGGGVCVFEDYVNYRTKLAGVREVGGEDSEVEVEMEAERGSGEVLWEPEGDVPESCVDWAEYTDLL